MPAAFKRVTLTDITHGRKGYAKGCGCEVCRVAEREYQNERRRVRGRERNTQGGNVRKLRAVEPRAPGEMEQAVIDECATLPAAQDRPTSVVQAKQLARILDNPDLVGMHPTTARQFSAVMAELRAISKKKSGGRLASVQRLTNRKVNHG